MDILSDITARIMALAPEYVKEDVGYVRYFVQSVIIAAGILAESAVDFNKTDLKNMMDEVYIPAAAKCGTTSLSVQHEVAYLFKLCWGANPAGVMAYFRPFEKPTPAKLVRRIAGVEARKMLEEADKQKKARSS